METAMRATFPVFLFATLAMACAAGAQVTPDDQHDHPSAPTDDVSATPREHIELLLSAYHGLPGRAELEEIDSAQAILWEIVNDPASIGVHRERALLSLGYWPDAALRTWLETMLRDADGEVLLAHDALLLYSAKFDDEAAVAIIAPLVQSEDVSLGLTAVEALRTMQSPGATAILRATDITTLAEPVGAAINAAIAP